MKILVIGSGGREHAIIWKLAKSKYNPKIFCAPGNAGIASLAECVPIKATDIDNILKYCKKNTIDLVFVAPDDPLAMGLVDILESNGIRAFGPTADAALIESSKSFSKELMQKYKIPTANYKVFTNKSKAYNYIETLTPPIVVKADGLALGKGVIIAQTVEEAQKTVQKMLSGEAFGESGRTVIIEEFLKGEELTVLAFTDGTTIYTMPDTRDHKKAQDNDEGLNTGGMGAICPGASLTTEDKNWMMDNIFRPTIEGMKAEGRLFKGVLYFGLMFTNDGPKVIEYNARLGDPEAQVVLPLLETDLIDIMNAIIDEKLSEINISWKNKSACCVVIASGGYPLSYEKGYTINGLENVDSLVFHSGTVIDENGTIVTSGGRVLGVTAIADSIDLAIDKAYIDVKKIEFTNMHYRTDIGRSK